jgi:uncharacterized Zn-finger protein
MQKAKYIHKGDKIMADTDKSLGANTVTHIEVTHQELPLSCPTPRMTLWNMHPKVYLPIEKTGKAVCPYCGTCYTLVKEIC